MFNKSCCLCGFRSSCQRDDLNETCVASQRQSGPFSAKDESRKTETLFHLIEILCKTHISFRLMHSFLTLAAPRPPPRPEIKQMWNIRKFYEHSFMWFCGKRIPAAWPLPRKKNEINSMISHCLNCFGHQSGNKLHCRAREFYLPRLRAYKMRWYKQTETANPFIFTFELTSQPLTELREIKGRGKDKKPECWQDVYFECYHRNKNKGKACEVELEVLIVVEAFHSHSLISLSGKRVSLKKPFRSKYKIIVEHFQLVL